MSTTVTGSHPTRGLAGRWLTGLGVALVWLFLAVLSCWAMAAICIDVRIPSLRIPLTVLYAAVLVVIVARYKFHLRAVLLCLGCFCLVLAWWLSLKPTNIGAWQADVDRPAWVEIDGDRMVIHNLRNCDYRTETDYSNCWSDRTVNLSDLRGADLFFTTWGVPWIGHPIVSFDFGDNQHVAFSIEARYKGDQAYSAILGFFRQYELIFVAADERDVIRLRTNFRKDEEVFLYRTTVDSESTRAIFLTYVRYLNQLKDHPEWYNALTRNCTTTLDKPISKEVGQPAAMELPISGERYPGRTALRPRQAGNRRASISAIKEPRAHQCGRKSSGQLTGLFCAYSSRTPGF